MDKLYQNTNLIFVRECFNLKIRFAKNIELYRKKLVEAITIMEQIYQGDAVHISFYIKTSKINTSHRENGPTNVVFVNNKVDEVYWDNYGKLHRDDGGPAKIWFSHGKLYILKWYNNGKLHRIGKPALIEFTNNKTVNRKWYLDGYYIKNDN